MNIEQRWKEHCKTWGFKGLVLHGDCLTTEESNPNTLISCKDNKYFLHIEIGSASELACYTEFCERLN